MGFLLLIVIIPLGWMFVSASSESSGLVLEQVPAPTGSLSQVDTDLMETFRPYEGVVPVLTYKDIDPGGGSDAVTPDEFASQMEMLDDSGFNTVTLDQVRKVSTGTAVDLPANPILITFDTGARGAWVHGDPILAAHGFGAAVFIATSVVSESENSAFLNVATLREMLKTDRWEIGGHTHAGFEQISMEGVEVPALATLLDNGGGRETYLEWEQRVRDDLATNKKVIKDEFGVDAFAMSYPFAEEGLPSTDPVLANRLPELVGEQFDLGFIETRRAAAVSADVDKTLVPRIMRVSAGSTPAALLGAIDETIPRSPANSITNVEWTAIGNGECIAGAETLIISADGYTSCRLTTATSGDWRDLAVAGQVSGVSPTATALIRVRESDSSGIEISIGENRLTVVSQINGARTTLAEAPIAPSSGFLARAFLIEARGSRVRVTLDGELVADVDVGTFAGKGTVSFSAQLAEAAVMTFTSVTLTTRDTNGGTGQ